VRFFEFQDSSNKELESVVVNTLNNLKGEADEEGQTSEISFSALEQIIRNTGYSMFNYELFKRMYDGSETLKSVVDDFNNEKIILKTDKEAEKDPEMDIDDQGSTDTVKKMAKSALNKRI
jgi:hypothetical protein